MSEDVPFCDLIRQIRAGDPQAAAELVRQYEPTIRMVVRRRLADPALRRLLDSMDVCQSVLASFFVRVASGQYDLERPEQLLKLLATMARNKVANAALKQRAARRDPRRLAKASLEQLELIDPHSGPCETVAGRELLQEFRRRLSAEERRLAEQRAQGRPWAEIAAEVGGSPDGLRMQLTRALDRVAHELGIDA
jgi:RNA polymerase sigma factor (sigma-70 family)